MGYEAVKQPSKNTKKIKELLDNFDYLSRNLRYTEDENHRYILAETFYKNLCNALRLHKQDSKELTDLTIENLPVIEEISKKLKSTPTDNVTNNLSNTPLDETHQFNMTNQFVLVAKEIMDIFVDGLEIDYVIKVPFKSPKVFMREGIVLSLSEYDTLRKANVKKKNFDAEDNINKAVTAFKNLELDFVFEEETNVTQQRHEENKNTEVLKITPTKKWKKEFKGLKKKDSKDKADLSNKLQKSSNISTTNSKVGINLNSYSNPSTPINESKNISDKSTTINKSYSSLILKLEGFKTNDLNPKGLYNPSVYCFMNTCMQCLASIPELNHYFGTGQFTKEKKSKKDPQACQALKEFVNSYENSSGSLKAPSSIYKVCHSFLTANTQHDCQEFLRRFLTKIQEELNWDKKYTIPDKASLEQAWNIYREINPSFVDSLFTGLMRSSVICNLCGHKSDTYDPFMDISVPIKKKPVESIESCLDYYFAKEHIDCEYKCSSCKKKTSVIHFLSRLQKNSK
jgi:hypothetical protein